MTGDDKEQKNTNIIYDDNKNIMDSEKLPVQEPLVLLRYRTIKKNNSLGWWSAVVLLEDHGKKIVCFYRWRKSKTEWKRDKKLPFRSKQEWNEVKDAIDSYINQL